MIVEVELMAAEAARPRAVPTDRQIQMRSTGCTQTRQQATTTARCWPRCSGVAALWYGDPRCAPVPGIDGTTAAWAGRVSHWHDTSSSPQGSAPLSHHHGQGRAMVSRLTSRDHGTRAMDPPDLRPWVAAVNRMKVGDYVTRRGHMHARAGTPTSPRTQAHNLMATRTFFRDGQEWE